MLFCGKRSVLLLLAALLSLHSVCQEANNWFFGQGAGITFSGGAPVAVQGGQTFDIEGCSSISDSTGQLLFYTDGTTLWNRRHQIMPNGAGLFGHYSSANSSIIIPRPGSNHIYYVFTSDAIEVQLARGYNYTEVDINLDGGLGDVTRKNVPLYAPCTEKLTAVRAANGSDIWVITKNLGDDEWRVFKVDCNGVDHNWIASHAGDPHTEGTGALFFGAGGCIKVSPDGTLLANARQRPARMNILRFDNSTGRVSGDIAFRLNSPYGVEFSPSSRLLYVYCYDTTGFPRIAQYDVSNYDSAAILGSLYSHSFANFTIGALQMGPDKKIYFAEPAD
ncbi:MAG: hypothetical protein JST39_14015, partial [Bacteroidetes bacterium]|nr:hypothetical protein [Bacteroidota bacterium]